MTTTTTTTSAARTTREERAALRAPLPESYRSLPQAEVDALWRSGSKIEQKRLGRAGLLPSWLKMSPNRARARRLPDEAATIRAIHDVLWVPPDAEWSADTLDEIGRLVPQSPRPRSHRLRAVHAVLWVPPDAEWNADSLDEIARIVPRGSANRAGGDRAAPFSLTQAQKEGRAYWRRLGDEHARAGREPIFEETPEGIVAISILARPTHITEADAGRSYLRGYGRRAYNRAAPDEPSLPVMFRVSKDADREVAAVFPTLPGTNDPSTVTVYAHVGQHGSAPWSYVRDRTRPATEAEYAPLLREVRSIYEGGPDPVRLRVVQRATRAMYDERRRAAGF